MKNMKDSFSEEAKIELADLIINNYYNHNFGHLSKSDLELLLFDQYYNVAKEKTDYELSKSLGITQTRVRTLKERRILQLHNGECNWKEEFIKAIENAKYDDTCKKIKIIIQDINVQNEIRNLIEEKGWYDDYSLNRKMIQIPLACFIDICDDLDDDGLITKEIKKTINTLKKYDSDNAIKEFVSDTTKDGLKNFVMSASTETMKLVLDLLPFGGLAGKAIELLVKKIL